jgi:hypothetical protein
VLKRGPGGGDRLAAIRGERSAALVGHRRADETPGDRLAAAGRPNSASIRSYLSQSPELMNHVLRPLVEVAQ